MSPGPASPNDDSNNKRRKTNHTTRPSSMITQRPPEELVAPTLANPTGTVAPLDAAIAKIESFVRTLRYAQQRAVFTDNAKRYITAFATFYRENKSLMKTKDDPTYCPASCRIAIPLQPTPRVKESAAFQALADESAGVAREIGLQMGKMVMKCKLLNNADKKRETIEIYARALSNMAEILLAELDTNTTDTHALVADLLTTHESDVINHLSISLPEFIDIYKATNNITALPPSHTKPPNTAPPRDKARATTINTQRTPIALTHTAQHLPPPTNHAETTTPHTHRHQSPTTTQGAPQRNLAGDFVTATTLLQTPQRTPPTDTQPPTHPTWKTPYQPPDLPTPMQENANTNTEETPAQNTFVIV